MSNIKRILTISGVAAAISVAGYAVWFDYQRRNNAEFRKNLRQRAKKQKKKDELEAMEAKKARVSAVLQFLSEELEKDPISTDPTEMEKVFTTNVEYGERLSMVPGNEMEAAVKFYKALAVYPNPADLLGIYQRTIPENIYEYIVIMIAVIPPANITSFINTGAAENSNSTKTKNEEEPLITELTPGMEENVKNIEAVEESATIDEHETKEEKKEEEGEKEGENKEKPMTEQTTEERIEQ
ncbi:Tom20 family protein PWA37_000219 [Arxiozyma heterogenica]|uniref:Mitochondrial import receptor subunit TOM20 n=1 Tax=Arxiozyma heterogenica TaxID=278026 RepID=A0AAN7WF88_9SACH|nr:hypothetical protein RI543_004190 [Kazachstania heterogenica]